MVLDEEKVNILKKFIQLAKTKSFTEIREYSIKHYNWDIPAHTLSCTFKAKSLYGVYDPINTTRKDVIPKEDMYPSVITKKQFLLLQSHLEARTNRPQGGRKLADITIKNYWKGIIHHKEYGMRLQSNVGRSNNIRNYYIQCRPLRKLLFSCPKKKLDEQVFLLFSLLDPSQFDDSDYNLKLKKWDKQIVKLEKEIKTLEDTLGELELSIFSDGLTSNLKTLYNRGSERLDVITVEYEVLLTKRPAAPKSTAKTILSGQDTSKTDESRSKHIINVFHRIELFKLKDLPEELKFMIRDKVKPGEIVIIGETENYGKFMKVESLSYYIHY